MLVCLTTILIGFSQTLSDNDKKVIASAKIGCERTYPESPCLVKLIKKEELVYNAICGAKVKK